MSVTPASPAPGRFRWTICGLLFCSVALNYIDRNIIGILKQPLSNELRWSETDYAHIASAFQMAYAFGYLFGGRVVDRLGVKRGLPWFVFLWSLAAAGHGLVSLIAPEVKLTIDLTWLGVSAPWVLPATVLGFMSARVALGLTEGGNFPGAIKTVAEWFPVKERALATGVFNAGTNVGAILCPIVVPWIYSHLGWATTFYVTGALGLVWLAFWWWLYEAPEKHPRLSAAELDYIRSGVVPVEEPKAQVSWLSLLRYRAVWAYLGASVLAGPVWGIYMFYFPDFMQKTFKLGLAEVGGWTAVFYLFASIGGVAGGWLSGRFLGLGWSVNKARKTTLLICAASVVPICLAPHAPSALVAVLIVGLAGSAHQGWSANLFSVVSDTMPKQAISSTVGLGGFVCFMTGAVVAEAIGVVLQKTGSYSLIFAAASLLYLVSLAIVQILVPRIGVFSAQSNPV
ncbi:MFS transporter [bacterium]|jgi:ACS family hexuronate transporter-like MFS transporter|nr:MFS transporter [bacterium]